VIAKGSYLLLYSIALRTLPLSPLELHNGHLQNLDRSLPAAL